MYPYPHLGTAADHETILSRAMVNKGVKKSSSKQKYLPFGF